MTTKIKAIIENLQKVKKGDTYIMHYDELQEIMDFYYTVEELCIEIQNKVSFWHFKVQNLAAKVLGWSQY